jgi:hypothetical protein
MLAAAIKSVSGAVPTRRTFGHLGWRRVDGRWVYLSASGAIGAGGPVDGVAIEVGGELAGFALPPVRDLGAAVAAALRLFDLDAVVAAAVWRAPLCEFLPADFSVFVAGRTGVFKSALLGVAQAAWGPCWDGVRFAANWRGTVNMIEKLAFLAKDALLVVDDFAVGTSRRGARELHEKAEGLLRGQGNRSGRGRMRADTSLRPTYFPRGIIAASGEAVPAGQSLRARMVIRQVAAGSVDVARLTEMQAAAKAGLLAEAMAGFVWYLAGLADVGGFPELTRWQTDQRARISAVATHMRTSDATAALMLGADVFLTFARAVGVIDAAEWSRRREEIWERLLLGTVQQGGEQAADDPVGLFVEAIPTVLASGKVHLADRRDEGPPPGEPAMLGWREATSPRPEVFGVPTVDFEPDDRPLAPSWRPMGYAIGWADGGGEMWLLPDAAIKAVNELLREQGKAVTLDRRDLGRRLQEGGWLTGCDRSTFTKTVKIKGATPRVFAMKREGVLYQKGEEGCEAGAVPQPLRNLILEDMVKG